MQRGNLLKLALLAVALWLSIGVAEAYSRHFCAIMKYRPQCADSNLSELERFDCVGRFLYGPVRGQHDRKVLHSCHGVGLGNSIFGLGSAAGLALLTGARLEYRYEALNRMFLPPMSDADRKRIDRTANTHHYSSHATFDYEKYGRSTFDQFANSVKAASYSNWSHPATHPYTGIRVLDTGLCGMDEKFLQQNECARAVLGRFLSCARESYLGMQAHNIPFAQTFFARPSPELVRILSVMRRRAGLPSVGPETESAPGHGGLRTPGYYMIAFHFRRIPLNFEPMSGFLNEPQHRDWRINALEGFWETGKTKIRKALQLAKCRNQTLLIYFATDDIRNLRPLAEQHWSDLGGRLIFGAPDASVGHMTAFWRENDVVHQESAGAHHLHRPAQIARSPHSQRRHAAWGVAEWWVLGNADWLVTSTGSNYAATSVAHGLGPAGRMERYDDNGRPVFRRSWDNDSYCQRVYAVDPIHAKQCPHLDD